VTPFAAQASLERRAAIAAMGGEDVGPLPVLWLIREALDAYNDMRCTPQTWMKARPVTVVKTVNRRIVLTPANGSRILVELNEVGSDVRSHEVPNAALVLHDAVKDDPVKAEKLLIAIESATQDGLR
jgi:hypothetical protein